MKKMFVFAAIISLMAGSLFAEDAPGQTYKIGDTGPAGGIIFYINGNNNDSWRYMEASPVDLAVTKWGTFNKDVSGTETGVGSGKRNTELIIAALQGEKGMAAQICKAYTLNGYNDWFLPSKDELAALSILMDFNLGKKNISYRGYWSSSQSADKFAYNRNIFHGNYGGYANKNSKLSIRAVRTF